MEDWRIFYFHKIFLSIICPKFQIELLLPRESIRESSVPRRVRPGGAGLQAAAERGPGPGLVPEQAGQVEEERAASQDWTLLWSIIVLQHWRVPAEQPGPALHVSELRAGGGQSWPDWSLRALVLWPV